MAILIVVFLFLLYLCAALGVTIGEDLYDARIEKARHKAKFSNRT